MEENEFCKKIPDNPHEDNFYMCPLGGVDLDKLPSPPIHCCKRHNLCGCSMIAQMMQRRNLMLDSPEIVDIGRKVFGEGKESYERYDKADEYERTRMHKEFYDRIHDFITLGNQARRPYNDNDFTRTSKKQKA